MDGTFWGTRSALQLMKAYGGAIVNLLVDLRHPRHGLDGRLLGGQGGGDQLLPWRRPRAPPTASAVNVVIPAVVETPATAGMLSDPAAKASTEKLIPLGRVGQPANWPTPSCSWPATRPPTSPAPRCQWTAAASAALVTAL